MAARGWPVGLGLDAASTSGHSAAAPAGNSMSHRLDVLFGKVAAAGRTLHGQLVGASSGGRRREPNAAELAVVHAMASELATQYEHAAHAHYFQAIHAAFFPTDPFVAVGPCWKAVGFQSPDPVKDLRGGGLLALQQLAHFVATYPAVAVEMRRQHWPMPRLLICGAAPPPSVWCLWDSRERASRLTPVSALARRHWAARAVDGGASVGRAYPWAAVGVNITRLLAELLGVCGPMGSPGNPATARRR